MSIVSKYTERSKVNAIFTAPSLYKFCTAANITGKICTEWILVRYSEGPLFRKSAVALNPNHNHNPIA